MMCQTEPLPWHRRQHHCAVPDLEDCCLYDPLRAIACLIDSFLLAWCLAWYYGDTTGVMRKVRKGYVYASRCSLLLLRRRQVQGFLCRKSIWMDGFACCWQVLVEV